VNAQQQLRVASRQQTAPLDITKLTSKYRTLGYINDGIVLCEHLATGRQVVVKQDTGFCYQRAGELGNEAAILELLPRHPNVVEYVGSVCCNAQSSQARVVGVIMDYYPLGDLYTMVERAGRLSIEHAREITYSTVTALAHCHSHGVRHRDLSLENMFIKNDGDVVLADFGLSISTRFAGDKVGKDFYCAPEVHVASNENPYDATATDMWSLGVCLFILLTGVPPFERACCEDPRFVHISTGLRGVQKLLRAWGISECFTHDALELVVGLLTVDPQQRMTLTQVANHPWLAEAVKERGGIDVTSPMTPNGKKRSMDELSAKVEPEGAAAQMHSGPALKREVFTSEMLRAKSSELKRPAKRALQ